MSDDELSALVALLKNTPHTSLTGEAADAIVGLLAERDGARAQRDAAKYKMLADIPEHAKVRSERNEAQAEVARLKGLLREARPAIRSAMHYSDLLARIDAALATDDRT